MHAFKVIFCSFAFFLFCSSSDIHAATIRELYEQAVDAYNQGQYDHAVELYKKITKISPNFAPAYVGIGLSLKSKGADIDEVMYYYKIATEMDPTNAQAFEQLGRLYYSLNNFNKAEKNFLKVLSIDPTVVSAKSSLAWIYLLAMSKPETAIRYFREVLKESAAPNIYFGLGMAYFANNNRIQAMDMITALRKMGQEDFAQRLEQMVRENKKVVLQQEDNSPEDPPSASTTVPADTGIKVRLRGKLSDAD